jgi:RimJ/RimL family protein N-acetyltransferase
MLQCNISGMDNRGIYTSLKTGKRIYLRPIRPQDSARLRESIANLSDQSRYFRFFSGMKIVPDAVLDRLLAVDGVDHLAWAALDLAEHDLPAIGVVRVIRDPKSGVAELAIATLDAFHNTGLARILMATIAQDCLHAGFHTLVANVLSENKKARSLFAALGGTCTHSEGAYMTFTFDVALMDVRLRAMDGLSGLAEVYAAFDRFDLSAPRLAG